MFLAFLPHVTSSCWRRNDSPTSRSDLKPLYVYAERGIQAPRRPARILDGLRCYESGTTSDLFFVAIADTGDVYALGAGGTIVHYDGSRWSSIPVSGLTAALHAADYTVDTLTGAVTGYFVVGDGGTILHSSDGVHWSPQASGTANDLLGLAVASDSNAAAVGAMGTILYYNGVTWSKQR